MVETVIPFEQKDILKLFKIGLRFEGFLAPRTAQGYELAAIGYYINAKDRYDFSRQVNEAQDAMKADDPYCSIRHTRYWRIVNKEAA